MTLDTNIAKNIIKLSKKFNPKRAIAFLKEDHRKKVAKYFVPLRQQKNMASLQKVEPQLVEEIPGLRRTETYLLKNKAPMERL